MRKTGIALTFILLLLFIAVIGAQSITRADPYFVPKPPQLPSVYIRSDGSVTPTTLPIQKVGDIYTFTGNIYNLTLVIQRSNIIIDGAGHTLQGNASGQGIHAEATNVTVRNLEINKFASAVIIFKASNNTITRNRITNNGIGIDLNEAKYNIVEGNTISSNNDLGILIYDNSDYNQIIGNNITSNGDAGIWCEGTTPTSDFISVIRNNISDHVKWGVLLRASYKCTVVGNYISKNECGIELYGDNSRDCIIAENNIASNEIGIRFASQYLSEIHHNNFLNNSNHVDVVSASKPVYIWNSGDQGNYWSDYKGTDANGDGIGDIPYVLNSDNVDSYPLMYPYDIKKGTITLPTPEPQPQESFPTTLVVASLITAAVVSISLLFYFKKRKRYNVG
jgi:parallel beta-helix repeat protein